MLNMIDSNIKKNYGKYSIKGILLVLLRLTVKIRQKG